VRATRRRAAFVATCIAALAVAERAQAQWVFCGLSTGGSSNYLVLDGTTQQTLHSGVSSYLTGVNGAAWSDVRPEVFLSRQTSSQVSRMDLASGAPVFSTLLAGDSACYGVELDPSGERLFTLGCVNPRELICIDVEPGSSTYGQEIARTQGLSSTLRDRWALSRSGRRAAVPPNFLSPTLTLEIVDTEWGSPTFFTSVVSTPIPFDNIGLPSVAAVQVTSDDQWALVVISNGLFDEVAALHIPTGVWLDHQPSTSEVNNFTLPKTSPTRAVLAPDDRTLLVAGQGGGGWAAKLVIDFTQPAAWSFTTLAPSVLTGATAIALSPDGATALISSPSPARLVRVAVASGAVLAETPIAANALALDWQGDCVAPPVVYCTPGTSGGGCAATIQANGVASLAATSGFTLDVAGVDGQKQGLIFYGLSGRTALAWGLSSSFFCVKQPTQRTPLQSTGGTIGACNGSLSIDWLAYVAANPGALGAPFQAGDTLQAQAWYRDPPSPKTTSLSDAVEFALCP